MGMQSAVSLRLLTNSVIIYLNSSVSLSVEYCLSHHTNLIQLLSHQSLLISFRDFTILIQLIVTPQLLRPHKHYRNQPYSPHPIINFSHKSHLTITNNILVTLSLSLTKSLSLSLFFTVSSNNNQQVLEKHFVVSESVHIVIV